MWLSQKKQKDMIELLRYYRMIVRVRDWLLFTFVTKEELKKMLEERGCQNQEYIRYLMKKSDEQICHIIDERLQNYPTIVPQIPDDSKALQMSLYKYMINSDRVRQSLIHDLMELNTDKKIVVKRVDDISAITRIEVSNIFGGLVSVLRVILRYTNPLYLSLESNRNCRWGHQQTQYRRDFMDFLYRTIVVEGKQIDRKSFYMNVKYALEKEHIEPIDFLLG